MDPTQSLSRDFFYRAYKIFYMRIWHSQLIPKLCVKHFVAMWRESLGAYKIITTNRMVLKVPGGENFTISTSLGERPNNYLYHPATQEFIECPEQLYDVLVQLKQESLKRGYTFKDVPERVVFGGKRMIWQTLEEQTVWLKSKGCKCSV